MTVLNETSMNQVETGEQFVLKRLTRSTVNIFWPNCALKILERILKRLEMKSCNLFLKVCLEELENLLWF